MVFRQHLFFLFLFYLELKDDHYIIPIILQNIRDQLLEHSPLNYCKYTYLYQNSLGSIHLNMAVGRNLDIA